MANLLLPYEIWRDVPGYLGFYQVSARSNVKSLQRTVFHPNGDINLPGKVLAQHANKGGHLKVMLTKGGSSKLHYVHVLMADAFHPERDKRLCVNHLDLDPRNNAFSNFEFCTQKRNVQHAVSMGAIKVGQKSTSAKLSDADVFSIRSSGEQTSLLADRYGVARSTIRGIRNHSKRKHQ